MDRNSAIGLTLIAALLLVYFTWFSPKPEPPTPKKDIPQTSGNTTPKKEDAPTSLPDSTLSATYGDLSTALKGTESIQTVETADLKILLNTKGGVISTVELKNYQTYDQKPLILLSPETGRMQLLARYNGKDIDLYQLFYTPEISRNGDSTVVKFTATLGDGSSLTQVYSIPENGFEIRYSLESKGFETNIANEPLQFKWNQSILLMEKDIDDTRNHTTINYYQPTEGFDYLSETSSDTEKETFSSPVKWISIKGKFFLSSIIAYGEFKSGEVETQVNPGDSAVVKQAIVSLQIPKEALGTGKNDFKFYFGPNDYQIIGDVSENFARNVYLGWPPVYWINKYAIFPVFHFLTKFFSNYGLIIVILVILLKLVLFPLSYKSYLSMAKMKVLKPELDEIKERVGDDQVKAQQEQMKLYQQVGVNPISGCIPVLLQMPILFAMFYLFPASIELRQQPFLWAEDLSTYDSLIQFSFSLPFMGSHISIFTLLMTATSIIYAHQNNQMSSVQGPMKSMSYIMPLIFFFVLNKFSAGLTFYYFISTLVTIGQQAIIKRFVDEDKIKSIMEENKKKNLASGGKKSPFLAKLGEAMKASEEARRKADEERKKRKDGKK
jgi:YidC/Oxa1 family membrane protein insertase